MNVVLHPAVRLTAAGKLHRAVRLSGMFVHRHSEGLVPAATDPRIIKTHCGIQAALVEVTPRGVHRLRCLTCFSGPYLPPDGPPVFGEHRQAIRDADTAPAWYPESDADREAKFRRWVKGGKS